MKDHQEVMSEKRKYGEEWVRCHLQSSIMKPIKYRILLSIRDNALPHQEGNETCQRRKRSISSFQIVVSSLCDLLDFLLAFPSLHRSIFMLRFHDNQIVFQFTFLPVINLLSPSILVNMHPSYPIIPIYLPSFCAYQAASLNIVKPMINAKIQKAEAFIGIIGMDLDSCSILTTFLSDGFR